MSRLIDKVEAKRTRPMRVLVLGMPRTGTISMYTALQRLGYHPFHMVELVKDPQRNFALWNEVVDSKFYNDGSLKEFKKEEFDKLLGEFDAVADTPCCLFPDELLEAYPNAKIILTKRSVDTWLTSMQNTVGVITSWSTMPWVAPFDRAFLRPFMPFLKRMSYAVCKDDYGDIARQIYIDHYAHVRKIAPEDRLLEFEASDGWEPLCKFLGHDIPSEPYPRTNDSASFISLHAKLYYVALGKAVLKIGAVAGPIAYGIWYIRSRR